MTDDQSMVSGFSRRAIMRNGLLVGLGAATVAAASASVTGKALADSNIPGTADGSTPPTQSQWMWCNLCSGMFYAGYSGWGACPFSNPAYHGQHGRYKAYTSSNYFFYYDAVAGGGWQGNWWWCKNCMGMWWGGGNGGFCPATNSQHQKGSNVSSYVAYLGSGSVGQNDWRYCRDCAGMFWGGGGALSYGVCPTGGQHNGTGSSNYQIPSNGTISFP
jgi:hypothetical protein